ncbi:glucose-6-phosphate dehydrogenase [Fructilactobacillus fructivorans]|uniref:Glucose-6-phosphate 1-dehydrogenase n=1 Tax=Fructilactobacillus fructivorans TaxID=1614 RepID=A0AAE6TWU2_9LACO|nr:glucose-6-phosphate dehydrogenase [Fructilactobacillus fructivorans]KRK57521.1 glucose-6-phosphate 1-dehydrogenase [Fructilactobacillus fructivorans]KRN39883.1 glucose-6-phosphate 1-dehydrogenase [Fructilactobacillus fructivorans]KRN42367.1 glucose-6-phosphate 1-dehydrogenase [Fructilactobacillus fructivorans]QFX93196.1 glucose-6-phosphate dehydrogenase [Fructilactobacillus fructivorans]RDV64812.1 glucose-6-phosphate dehydrogenase [Fructilactobacillus fructivorans]
MATANRALFMLFGGTGDLALRKLYPALFELYKKGSIDNHFALLGLARRPHTDEEFQKMVLDSISSEADNQEQAEEFASHFYFRSHDVTNVEHYRALSKLADELDKKYELDGNRIFYVSMAPRFFGIVAKNLKDEHVLSDNGGFNRLVIEKPFGRDYDSAEKLNNELTTAFKEDQIFRIDHYLGKEMVQSIPVIRFGNPIIDAVWNHNYIDNIQITLSEKLGVEDRAGYYDTAGALRDMVQNHTMQIMTLLAMDKPASFVDTDVRAAKIKTLENMNFYDTEGVKENFVRGQYGAGSGSAAYRDEPDVPHDSNNDTFVAGKVTYKLPRWEGTPFYVRTGKKLAAKATRVDVVFKKDINNIFAKADLPDTLKTNVLSILIDPRGGITLRVNVKDSKQGFHTETIDLDYLQNDARASEVPQPYERLFHDILNGDHTNFASWPEVAAAWKYVDPIQKYWDETQPDFPNYEPGSMGPKASDELLARDGHSWYFPEEK